LITSVKSFIAFYPADQCLEVAPPWLELQPSGQCYKTFFLCLGE